MAGVLSRWWNRFSQAMNPPVFLGSAGVVVFFVVLGSCMPDRASSFFQANQTRIVENFGWAYVVVASAILVFILWLGFGRYGGIRLGPGGAEPEFSFKGWLAMLFSAGMGTGLVFWGVAEPLSHFVSPPFGPSGSPAVATGVEGIHFHRMHRDPALF